MKKIDNVLEKLENIVEYHNKNLTKKQYYDLLECIVDLKEIKCNQKYYTIFIRDNDDNYLYTRLLYDNVNDYNKALKLIAETDEEYKNDEHDNYYEYLMESLVKNNLLGLKNVVCNVGVR